MDVQKFVEKAKKVDQELLELQAGLKQMVDSGMSLEEVQNEVRETKLDGINLEEFLGADTPEKRLKFFAALLG